MNLPPSHYQSGAIFYLFDCPIHWVSRLQRTVALSSCEAEYYGVMTAAREGLFLRDLLSDLGLPPAGPTPIFTDSKSAIDLSDDPVAFHKTKPILRAAHFLRDLTSRLIYRLHFIPGKANRADLFTKALYRQLFLTVLALADAPVPSLEA